jgi:hypothetical protein
MAILLIGLFAAMSNVSLAQTATDTSLTNSARSNYLTYEDTARGFIMQYPSDWNKTDYPPTIGFISPAQNATDKFFESIIVTSYSLPIQNVTLDQLSHSLIEELSLKFHEFDVLSPPKETMLGAVPAYNLTYTFTPPEDLDPPMVAKPLVMQIWTVKDDKVYSISYVRAEGRINSDIDNVAKKMIGSFELLPSRQISTSEGPRTVPGNATMINQTGNNYLTYFNSTYGVQIGYPRNWKVSEYPTFDYGIAYIFPDSENETTLDLGAERLPYKEIALDGYLESRLDFSTPLNLSESNTNTTTLAGRPAYKLVYYELPFSNDSRKVMEIGAIIDGRVYQATYSTSPDRFLENLPTIQRILDTLKIVPTDKPPVPPSVNDRGFLMYENSTLGIKMQYPSGSEILRKTVLDDEDVPYDVGFRLPDEKHPESSYDVLFVEVIPLPYAYNVSESVYIDEYVPVWVSGAKESLTDFNLTKSRITTLDDSPAQVLEHTHFSPELEGEIKGLNVFAVKDNILYHIGYESTDPLAYYDHIPIIQKMIESFEILDTKGMPQEIF